MTACSDSSLPVRAARPVLLLGAALAAAALVTGCSSGPAGPAGGPYGTGAVTSPTGHARTSTAATAGVRVGTRNGPLGTYLTDGAGRTLYMFAADTASSSHCTGSCATYWPPLTTTGATAAAGSARASDLATIARPGGARQVSYAGHPLYYYVGDRHAGDTTGQASTGSGARWWVLAPSGKPITAGPPTGGASSSSGAGAWG